MTSSKVLKLYDVSKPTKIRVDGSKLNGISAILYQKHDSTWFPVSCASRFLSITEKNYHPIEVEMLAVSWGCQKMNMYLYGLSEFIVQTDHKPLIPILNNKMLIDMSPRIQRMRMTLLKYSFKAEHVQGTTLLDADALSRAPVDTPTKTDEMAERDIITHVNAIIQAMPATSTRLQEIRDNTATDTVLQKLRLTITQGWPNTKQDCREECKPYFDSRHDITEIEGLLVKGNRIIIPTIMRKDILSRIHVGHQGMEKCKRRARLSCYWPLMNQQIENMIRKCSACSKYAVSKPTEALNPPPVPTKPWQKVGTDLFEVHGQAFLVVTDYYSLWPEVYLLRQTTSKQVIDVIKDVFSRHGIPDELYSDNGPQYSSTLFKTFTREWNFTHTTSSPRYPKSNGLAESSVKTVKLLIKKCLLTNQDIKEGLLAIRNTPLQCGFSPAQLLMGRTLQDNLPNFQDITTPPPPITRDLQRERAKQKIYHDDIHRTVNCPAESEFHQGQRVRIQHHTTKEWTIDGIVRQKVAPRSYLVDIQNGSTLRRNTKDIRKVFSLTSFQSVQNEVVNNALEFEGQDSDSETETSDGSETIPYNDEDEGSIDYKSDTESDTLPYDEESEIENEYITKSGRVCKKKSPVDYDEL